MRLRGRGLLARVGGASKLFEHVHFACGTFQDEVGACFGCSDIIIDGLHWFIYVVFCSFVLTCIVSS